MGNANYIGRVGALAVALGIGTAVVTTPWVAVAEPTADSSPASDSPSSDASSGADSAGDSKTAASDDIPSSTQAAPGTPEAVDPTDEDTDAENNGGTSATPQAPEPAAVELDAELETEPASNSPEQPPVSNPVVPPPATEPVALTVSSNNDSPPQGHRVSVDPPNPADPAAGASTGGVGDFHEPAITVAVTSARSTAPVVATAVPATAMAAQLVPAAQPLPAAESPVSVVTGLVSGLLAWVGLSPGLTSAPAAPAEAPLLWGLLAWLRREAEQTPFNQSPATAHNPAENSQSVDGVITGDLNAVDADGDPLSFTVTQTPQNGTEVVNPDGTVYVTTNGDDTVSAINVPTTQSSLVTLQGLPVLRAVRANLVSIVLSGLQGLVVRVSEAFQRLFLNRTPTTAYDPAENNEAVDGVVTGDLNAVDADGDPLSFTLIQAPQKGTVELHSDGTFTYTQSREFAATGGTDVFIVKVEDEGDHFHGLRGLFQPDAGHSTTATVAIFDPKVIATIDVDDAPQVLAISPDGTTVYVPNVDDTVSVIDTATNSVTDTVTVGNGPEVVAVSPDGTTAYVASYFDDTVSVIDTESNTVTDTVTVGGRPVGVAVSPDGATVYVANGLDGTVSVIDTESDTVTATIAVGDAPYAVAISPDGAHAYVTNRGDDTVSVIYTATNTVTATIAVGDVPFGVAVSTDGAHAYVANYGDDTVSVIDTETNTVIDTIAVGNGPKGVAVSPDGTRVYVANGSTDTVSVIYTATNTVIDTIAVGGAPQGVAVSPDGTRLYVTSEIDGTVSVVSV